MIRSSKRARGFTLVELLVGVAVSSIILIAVAAAVMAINGAYNNESQIRSAVEGGRTGLTYIEKNLRMAGYGIEPQYAFDFTSPTGAACKNNCVVDSSVNAIASDDLAFRYRDPYFLRRGTASLSTSSIAVDKAFGVALPNNTALIVACPGAVQRAWFRTTSAATASATSVGVTAYSGWNSPTATALDCIGQTGDGAPYVFLIHEMRIRVFTDNNSNASFRRSWLMMVPDLSKDVSTIPDNAEPLAADVEDFQVSYIMNRPFPTSAFASMTPVDGSGGNWILGDGSVSGEGLPDQTVTNPSTIDAYDSANRYNKHPANIRAVRVSLSLRSTRSESNTGNTTSNKSLAYPRTAMEDGAVDGGPSGYYRTWVSSTVRTANMMSRSFFLPALSTSSGDNLNTNGS